MNNLQTKYKNEIMPSLKKELKLTNDLSVPKFEKVVLNIGAGLDLGNDKDKEAIVSDLASIAGQKPSLTAARKAIAGFKIREGQLIGAKVTLRGKRMYDFLEKLTTIVFPRVRDFRGISTKSFDGRGGYSLGFRDQIVFPEIDPAKINKYRGLQITIVTTAKTESDTKRLLEMIGMPFRKG